MNKSNGKLIAMAVVATFIAMYAVRNVAALESIRHAVGLDD